MLRDKEYKDITVLDIGCGSGIAITMPIASLGFRILGVDMYKPAIEYAKRVNTFSNLSFLCEEVEKVSINEPFDIIICADILEHLEEPLSVLRKLYTLLENEGLLIASVPNGFGPFEIEKFLTEKTGLLKITTLSLSLLGKCKRALVGKKRVTRNPIPYNEECGHVHFFTMRVFAALLSSAKFKIVKVKHGSFIGAPFSEIFLGRLPWFVKWNVKFADSLPYWAVSVWYLCCKKI